MSTVATCHELKGLQVRATKLQARLNQLASERSALDREFSAAQRELASLNQRIAEMTREAAEPVVTEHAMLRYLERAKGMDLDALRGEILTDKARAAIVVIGSGKVPVNGVTLVVKDRAVVSVVKTEKGEGR